MSELNENMGEIIEDLTYPVETPTEEIIELPPQRVNAFCIIRKEPWGEYNVHDIQDNSSWGSNPNPEEYAVVPDDMVTAIKETRGFVDIELNEDETEVVSFTALEIPEIPEPSHEPTQEERIAQLEANNSELAEQIAVTELTMIENYEAQEEINAQTENALIEIYEMMEV